jgi:hypothetical protein
VEVRKRVRELYGEVSRNGDENNEKVITKNYVHFIT